MTTRRESTARRRSAAAARLAATLACLAAAGCGGGGSDGRGAQDTAGSPSSTAPTGPTGTRGGAPVLLPATAPCDAGGAFRCTRLRVPLDREARAPDGDVSPPRLTLRVAIERGPRPPRGYLVALTGGPGQPGLPFAARLRARVRAASAGYGLVLLDQRGTGAGALRCPKLQRSVGSSDVAVAVRGSVEACARRLDPRRGAYTTSATVADLDDLRRALGARRLSLLGISYGSFVAERYALAHPDRVRALVLDSVVPQTGADVLLVSSMAAVPRVLRAVCVRVRCRGDVRLDLRAALARGTDGVALLDTLVALSIGTPRLGRVLPLLHEAARGRLDGLQRLTAAVRSAEADVPTREFSSGLHATTLCAEANVPWRDVTTPPADREQALAQSRAKLTPGRLGGFEPATAVGNGLADTCRRWPTLPRPVAAPSGPLPAIPTLLLAGELDLSTPVEDARVQLTRAPRGQLREIPGAGHSVVFRDRSGCALRALARFLGRRIVPVRCA